MARLRRVYDEAVVAQQLLATSPTAGTPTTAASRPTVAFASVATPASTTTSGGGGGVASPPSTHFSSHGLNHASTSTPLSTTSSCASLNYADKGSSVPFNTSSVSHSILFSPMTPGGMTMNHLPPQPPLTHLGAGSMTPSSNVPGQSQPSSSPALSLQSTRSVYSQQSNMMVGNIAEIGAGNITPTDFN